ncbi:SHOCT domain-containing protein [uncultured Leifsonia sp.]|uniref:SHOCT domain-containing protein n=1 Tax=uncultured Leifsonia sp. TaxID=340359 RepID=UPI0025EF0DFB|nr:SHOCT domain-containing protein [uncultured Leifsonia sp.]
MPLGRMGRPGLIGMAARTAVVAGTATAVSGNVQRRQAQRAQDKYDQQQYEADQQQAQMQQMAQQAAAQQAAQQQAAQQQAAAAAPAAAPSAADDMMAQLQQLATLHSQGILSDDEFSAAKAKLLA